MGWRKRATVAECFAQSWMRWYMFVNVVWRLRAYAECHQELDRRSRDHGAHAPGARFSDSFLALEWRDVEDFLHWMRATWDDQFEIAAPGNDMSLTVLGRARCHFASAGCKVGLCPESLHMTCGT